MKKEELPTKIPVFPLNNFIIFPGTTVPLNIFEPRYIEMVDECMKGNRIIGMIQPRKTGNIKNPDLYEVGCAGKITSFNETDDGRYLIIINGICRFRILNEAKNQKLFREFNIKFDEYFDDFESKEKEIKFTIIYFFMKILLTGGAGYIGSHVLLSILDNNYDVTVVDDLSTGNKNLIPKDIKLINTNINNSEKISNILKQENFDLLLHFAGFIKVEESVQYPDKYFKNNTDNAIELFETCYKNNLKNIIFSSTAAVYGNPITNNSIFPSVIGYNQNTSSTYELDKSYWSIEESLEVNF